MAWTLQHYRQNDGLPSMWAGHSPYIGYPESIAISAKRIRVGCVWRRGGGGVNWLLTTWGEVVKCSLGMMGEEGVTSLP